MEDEELGYSRNGIREIEAAFGDGILSPAGAALPLLLEGANVAGRDVLDVGCGTGGPALRLVSEYGARRVHGIDIGIHQVERARARAEASGLSDRLTFTRVEPGALPLSDASFDLVFSADVLVHVEDKALMFREMARVVRSGGELLVSDHLLGDPDAATEVEACWTLGDYAVTLMTPEDTAKLVSASGFENVRVEDLAHRYPAAPVPPAGSVRFLRFWSLYLGLVARGAVCLARLRACRP